MGAPYLEYNRGDLIGIISAPGDTCWWTGIPHKGPVDPNRFIVYRRHMFRLPTQEERPDLELIDPLTPILGYGESSWPFAMSPLQERATMSGKLEVCRETADTAHSSFGA